MTTLVPYPTLQSGAQLSDVIAAINKIAQIRQQDTALFNGVQNNLTPAAVTSFTGDGTVLSNTPSSTGTATLLTQAKNTVLAGPASGGNAAPTFRALVTADVPSSLMTALGVGSVIAAKYTASLALTAGQTTAASNLVAAAWTGTGAFASTGDSLTGTWQTLTSIPSQNDIYLFQRTA